MRYFGRLISTHDRTAGFIDWKSVLTADGMPVIVDDHKDPFFAFSEADTIPGPDMWYSFHLEHNSHVGERQKFKVTHARKCVHRDVIDRMLEAAEDLLGPGKIEGESTDDRLRDIALKFVELATTKSNNNLYEHTARTYIRFLPEKQDRCHLFLLLYKANSKKEDIEAAYAETDSLPAGDKCVPLPGSPGIFVHLIALVYAEVYRAKTQWGMLDRARHILENWEPSITLFRCARANSWMLLYDNTCKTRDLNQARTCLPMPTELMGEPVDLIRHWLESSRLIVLAEAKRGETTRVEERLSEMSQHVVSRMSCDKKELVPRFDAIVQEVRGILERPTQAAFDRAP